MPNISVLLLSFVSLWFVLSVYPRRWSSPSRYTDNWGIKGKYFTIEIDSSFGKNQGAQQYSYHAKQSLVSLLNSIFYDLTPDVKPFTLGTAWAIVDSETGERLHQLESDWGCGKSSKQDKRTLEEAGIQPGMRLRVIRL